MPNKPRRETRRQRHYRQRQEEMATSESPPSSNGANRRVDQNLSGSSNGCQGSNLTEETINNFQETCKYKVPELGQDYINIPDLLFEGLEGVPEKLTQLNMIEMAEYADLLMRMSPYNEKSFNDTVLDDAKYYKECPKIYLDCEACDMRNQDFEDVRDKINKLNPGDLKAEDLENASREDLILEIKRLRKDVTMAALDYERVHLERVHQELVIKNAYSKLGEVVELYGGVSNLLSEYRTITSEITEGISRSMTNNTNLRARLILTLKKLERADSEVEALKEINEETKADLSRLKKYKAHHDLIAKDAGEFIFDDEEREDYPKKYPNFMNIIRERNDQIKDLERDLFRAKWEAKRFLKERDIAQNQLEIEREKSIYNLKEYGDNNMTNITRISALRVELYTFIYSDEEIRRSLRSILTQRLRDNPKGSDLYKKSEMHLRIHAINLPQTDVFKGLIDFMANELRLTKFSRLLKFSAQLNASLPAITIEREQPLTWTRKGWSQLDMETWIDKMFISTLRTRSDAFLLATLGCDGFRETSILSWVEEWEIRVDREGRPCCEGELGCSGIETTRFVPHILDPDGETIRRYLDGDLRRTW